MHTNNETLRTGWTLDGQRIFVIYQPSTALYRVATRWAWLLKFKQLQDAADAFETLEFLQGNISDLAKYLAIEIHRVPRHARARTAPAMARVAELVRCVERRMQGQRPQACGSKLAVVKWVEA